MATQIHFLLNDRVVCTSEPGGLLALDYLRKKEHLTGTKEGCKEGDCGACVVLLGELQGDYLHYRPVTSCLTPLGELQGKHLVTIEGLNFDNKLSPVQQAIVDEGGSQCGFCTPGIVVSLTGFLMQDGWNVSPEGIKKALSGHLCRCTGYASLKRAGAIIEKTIGQQIRNKQGNRIATLIDIGVLPSYFRDAVAKLRALPAVTAEEATQPSEYFVAGGTDIYVQKGEALPEARVKVLNSYPEIRGINRRDGQLHVGALTTFEEIGHHPQVLELMPGMPDYLHLIASWQICNRATLGGNIVNASPIGDMTAIFLALEAELVLRDGLAGRNVPMREFYKGYKKLDKKPAEILTEVVVKVRDNMKFNFEKVSKRKCLDIASVTSAMRIRCDKGVIADIGLSMGGVAPIPLFMRNTCAQLIGKPVTKDTVQAALATAQGEISPISDIRGSADYKRLLVRQFIIAHFCKLFPESVKARDLL